MNYNRLTKKQLIDIILNQNDYSELNTPSLFLYRYRNGRLFMTNKRPMVLCGEVYPEGNGCKDIELDNRMFPEVHEGTCKVYYTDD